MLPEELVRLVSLLSVTLIVFGFALRSTRRDLISLFRSPTLLLRALLAMNVISPLLAAIEAVVLDIRQLASKFSERMSPLAGRVGVLLFVAAVVPMVFDGVPEDDVVDWERYDPRYRRIDSGRPCQ